MLSCQKDSFSFPPDVRYINCATFSPNSKAVEAAGIQAIQQMSPPTWLKGDLFFEQAQNVQKLFAALLHIAEPNRVCLIPSASYGMAIVAKNLHRIPNINAKKQILLIENEFPNNMYAFEREAAMLNLDIKTIARPEGVQIGKEWNKQILERINTETALIIVPPVHWIYGTRFDLMAISARCRETNTLLIVDATQASGAYELNVAEIKPDALFSVGYKWLMGAYSCSFGYLGEFFDEGIPVEETWMNRKDSNQFHQIMNYQPEYRPLAQRYNAGEFSNFSNLPMQEVALQELLAWGVGNIQNYCAKLMAQPLADLVALGCGVEDAAFRANHLVGVHLPPQVNPLAVQESLNQEKIIVAVRGSAIRISPHIYNNSEDLSALVTALEKLLI